MSDPIEQYLTHYAEAKSKACAETLSTRAVTKHCRYKQVVVVPCFKETPAFAERILKSSLWTQSVLMIVVINQAENTAIDTLNQILWDSFSNRDNSEHLNDTLLFCPGKETDNGVTTSAFLVINCFSKDQKLPEKHGVGLARKIGCDLALALQMQGLIENDWIYSTDADAELPNDYFTPPPEHLKSESAMMFSHQHVQGSANDHVFAATQLYEQAINYYTQGLAWAGSPYAFPTIGSCLAVHTKAYAQSRGFPKRAAAEDFYLLNKLAKLSPVFWQKEITIPIQARLSGRNPFGTGPAVQTIVDTQKTASTYLYYAPEVFTELKLLLDTVCEQLTSSQTLFLSKTLRQQCEHLKLSNFEAHLNKQSLIGKPAIKAWHDWFDAFKTLKFVRGMQQNHFPALPLQTCLDQAEFL